MRIDYTVLLALSIGLALWHWREIHWGWFLVAFGWIDVVGYVPGALWYRLRAIGERRSIPALFHHAYNLTHNVGVNAVLLLLWYLAAGGWDWTMLAQPIHLLGDRGLFGNVYKPVELSFEPLLHPSFEKLDLDLQGAGRW
jgi:hypothetical protein